uniref:Ska2 N-terminal domain-containing protein n=1 Tax=Sciurus vulgaris TaxID=55149 RepID=A0A8D2DWA2_SCIVU
VEMEVDKLELMLWKADSDLDYIEYRLEYKIKTNHSDSSSQKNSFIVKQTWIHHHSLKKRKP